MTTVHHYKANLRDIFFNLFEVLDIGANALGRGPFAAMDETTAREALTGMLDMVQEAWAPSFAEGDRQGVQFDGKGNVKLPAGYHKALEAYYSGGWNNLELPEHLGGFGAPPSVAWAGFELMSGANPAVVYYALGNFHTKLIDRLGTEDQKRRFVAPALKGHWGGTMVLTEPDAGSDVGAGTTSAKHVAGDEYHLTGVKRFITNGDFDYGDNILHLVLARPEGAGPGTKGLSMFVVPKYWVEADGTLGARNGVVVTKVEHKMGIKGSATCELTLGADAPCRGLLVGGVHNGIAQMFQVIEYARMGVGTKSVATMSTAYLNALEYTKLRKQGPDLTRAMDKTAPRVEIIRHPDVRRMLMLQKSFAEGLRALVLFTAHVQDEVLLRGGPEAPEARAAEALNDLLLPLVKGYSSEKVYELLSVSLQCFGGSGYCEDYPIEQYIRDQKIDSLYEGTTHIQALDLLLRKIGRDRGATLEALLAQVKATAEELAAVPELAEEKAALEQGLADLRGTLGAMMGKLAQSMYHVGLEANRVLAAVAELIIGWRLVVAAQVAQRKLPAAVGDDVAFYRGKLAAARFYVRNVLPGLGLVRQLVAKSELDLMTLPDEAF